MKHYKKNNFKSLSHSYKKIISLIILLIFINIIYSGNSNAKDVNQNEENKQINNTDILSNILSSSMKVDKEITNNVDNLVEQNIQTSMQFEYIELASSFIQLNENNKKNEEQTINIKIIPKEDQSNISNEKANDDGVITIDNIKYKVIKTFINSNVTAYDNGVESTGKRKGSIDYAVTRSGVKTHWGTVAIDKRYHKFGDLFYVVDDDPQLNDNPNHKLFVAEDTGSAIKGEKRFDLWFDNKNDADYYGRKKNVTIYQLEKIE
jgi:3D (Asp-Asp-Asp) domain-containing protein